MSSFDTAIPACSRSATASASTISADIPRPCLRWRCRNSAIDQASSLMGSTSIASGNAVSCDRNRARTCSGTPATGADRLPAGPGWASDKHRRRSHRPVVATPAGAIPPKSGARSPVRISRNRWSSTTTEAAYGVARSGSSPPPTIRRWSPADRALARSSCRPSGGRRITASPKSTTVTRPPWSRPHRGRTAAGTDICPLVETRNSAGVAMTAPSHLVNSNFTECPGWRVLRVLTR